MSRSGQNTTAECIDGAVTGHSGWRLRLGEAVCRAYAEDPAVASTTVAGSVARDWADEHSDIDLVVVWAVPLSDVKRRKAVERAGGSIEVDWSREGARASWAAAMEATAGRVGELWPCEDGEYSERFYVDGVNVGVSGFLGSTVDATVVDLTGDCRPTDDAEMLAASIVDGIDITGGADLADWRARLSRYPDELAAAIIRREIALDGRWWSVDQLAARNDRPALDAVLAAMQHRIFRMLLALNRRYLVDPKPKWSAHVLALLRVTPGDLTARWTSLRWVSA